MGLMKRIFSGGVARTEANVSDHNINKSAALGSTDANVPSPLNANFKSIRTAPVVEAPRFFSINEAQALTTLADQKRKQCATTQQAYRALSIIDNADTTVHEVHKTYETKLAKNEVKKVEANAAYAVQLHALRPAYEQASQRIGTAENGAANRIAAIRATYNGNS